MFGLSFRSSSSIQYLSKKRSVLGICFSLSLLVLTPSLRADTLSISTLSGKDLLTDETRTLNLAEAKKATVLVFLSSKCPCSQSHEPILNYLAQKYSPLGFKFIGIHSNADEPYEVAKTHFQSSHFIFPVINDPKSEIAEKLKAYKTPHIFLVGPKLEILFQGGVDSHSTIADIISNRNEEPLNQEKRIKQYLEDTDTHHYLKEALDAVQLNQPIKSDNVRVLGCVIRRP